MFKRRSKMGASGRCANEKSNVAKVFERRRRVLPASRLHILSELTYTGSNSLDITEPGIVYAHGGDKISVFTQLRDAGDLRWLE